MVGSEINMLKRRTFIKHSIYAILLYILSLLSSARYYATRTKITRKLTKTGGYIEYSSNNKARVDPEKCLGIICCSCLEVCPVRAITIEDTEKKPLAIADKSWWGNRNKIFYIIDKQKSYNIEDVDLNKYIPYSSSGIKTTASVNQSICIGCGICRQACPVTPIKAIELVDPKKYRNV